MLNGLWVYEKNDFIGGMLYLSFSKDLFILFEMIVKEMERHRNIPSVSSLSTWLQWLKQGQAEARS